MSSTKALSTKRLLLIELTKKLQEIGARESKLTKSMLHHHQLLSMATGEGKRASIRQELTRIDDALTEVRAQYDVVRREVDEAIANEDVWSENKDEE